MVMDLPQFNANIVEHFIIVLEQQKARNDKLMLIAIQRKRHYR